MERSLRAKLSTLLQEYGIQLSNLLARFTTRPPRNGLGVRSQHPTSFRPLRAKTSALAKRTSFLSFIAQLIVTLLSRRTTLTAKLSADLQIGLTVSRPSETPGFKVGNGEKGGFSYFGADANNAEGYVVHRFWPCTTAEGHIIRNGVAQVIKASTGMFVHAIQGMRPNLVASRWNFGWFSTLERGGVSAIQMEFTTLDTYGKTGSGSGATIINIGSIVIGGKLVSVTAETRWKGEESVVSGDVQSRAVHYNTVLDPDTSYHAPSKLGFYWTAPSIIHDATGKVKAELEVETGSGHAPEGLVEKVDILGEIPWALKQFVHATGTKPYMYQWLKPATLKVTAPTQVLGGDKESEQIPGNVYVETTFIS